MNRIIERMIYEKTSVNNQKREVVHTKIIVVEDMDGKRLRYKDLIAEIDE